jgi:hypothetical protein
MILVHSLMHIHKLSILEQACSNIDVGAFYRQIFGSLRTSMDVKNNYR